MDDARNQDGEQESRTHKTSNKHFRNHKYRMLFGAVMLLAIGFAPGYFVGAMRHDNTPAENYEQSAQEDANTELAEESFEEEPFESAPIKQAPEKQADSADTVEAMTVKIQDSVLTTWTYEGTDKKSH
ncbi:MAG: hypothetical protein ACRD4B_07680, partial [Acidobacteriota bacterium]